MNDYLFFKTGRSWTKVNKNDIIYIKSTGCYCQIKTDEKTLICNTKISSISNTYALSDQFIRIHKQFIINANHLTTFSKSYVLLGTEKIPIGKLYLEEFYNKLFFMLSN